MVEDENIGMEIKLDVKMEGIEPINVGIKVTKGLINGSQLGKKGMLEHYLGFVQRNIIEQYNTKRSCRPPKIDDHGNLCEDMGA